MMLINPTALAWGLLAVALAAFYLWRIRSPRQPISADFLWRRALGTLRPRAVWRPWRRPVSLVIQLAILTLLVLALAEPLLTSPRQIVLVIDNSASMNATDVAPSRLDQAKQVARAAIDSLGYRDRMALVSAGGRLRVHCGMTSRKSTLLQAVEALPAGDGSTRVDRAIELGNWILRDQPFGRIVVISDGCFDSKQARRISDASLVKLIRVGSRADNLGITRLVARRSPANPTQCQVFAELGNFSEQAARCRVRFAWDGKPIESLPVELAPGGRWRQTFEMNATAAGRISARLDDLKQPDVLAEDNRASTRVPALRTYRVVLVSSPPKPASTENGDGLFLRYLQKVFEANPLVELTVADKPPADRAEGTIVVLDRPALDRLPAGPLLVVDPAAPSDLWTLGDEIENEDARVAKQAAGHPVLEHVRLEGISLGVAGRIDLTEAARPNAVPLALSADNVPLAWAIEQDGRRVLLLSGSLTSGELAQRTAYPILMSNALAWLAGEDDRRPSESPPAVASSESDLRGPLETGTTAGLPGSASDKPNESTAGQASSGTQLLAEDLPKPWPPLWPYLVAAALALAAVDWCLYQRRWTC